MPVPGGDLRAVPSAEENFPWRAAGPGGCRKLQLGLAEPGLEAASEQECEAGGLIAVLVPRDCD